MTEHDVPDTSGQLDAVERSVSVEHHDRTVHTEVALSQTYRTDIHDLWEACTPPERLVRWLGSVGGELRVGGRYRIEGVASGTIQTCDPPHGFTATWEHADRVSWFTVRLEPHGDDRTRLVLTHTADEDREDWATYGSGAGGVGWDLALLGLAHHLATGSATPPEATTWIDSDGAHRFIADSSRRWADEAVVAGVRDALARAAQERTTATFLGHDAVVDGSGPG